MKNEIVLFETEDREISLSVETDGKTVWLRRYRPDDAEQLYEYFGSDPEMYQYSGWNPYTTLEMARETVRRFIDSYKEEHTYSWVIDANGDDVVAGTIGAYDYQNNQISVIEK